MPVKFLILPSLHVRDIKLLVCVQGANAAGAPGHLVQALAVALLADFDGHLRRAYKDC